MNRTRSFGAGVVAAGLLMTASAQAHVKMLKPTPWIVESDGLAGGNPQKAGPCGPGASDRPMLTNAITTFKAGETITVQWTETVGHPGYYRIALAENRADLKDPTVPFTSQNQCNVDHKKIPTGAHDNVLADGIMIQEPNGPARPGYPNFSFQVKLPDKPCEKCTLQLIQFMEAHPPSCIYYHCADIKIVAAGADAGVTTDAGTPTDAGAAADAGSNEGGSVGSPTADAGSPTTTRDASTGTTPGTSVGGGPVVGSTPGADGGAGTIGTGTAGTGGGTTGANGAAGNPAMPDDDEGGCAVSPANRRAGATWLVSLLALALLARRLRKR